MCSSLQNKTKHDSFKGCSYIMLSSLFFDSRFDSLHITDFLDLESLHLLTQVSKQFRKIKHNVSSRSLADLEISAGDPSFDPDFFFKFPFHYNNPITFSTSSLYFLPQFVKRCALRHLRNKSTIYSGFGGLEFIDTFMKRFSFVQVDFCDLSLQFELPLRATIPINIMSVRNCGNLHLMLFENFIFVDVIEYSNCVFTQRFASHFPHRSTTKIIFTNCEFQFPFVIANIMSVNLRSLSFVNCVFANSVHFNVMDTPQLEKVLIDNCPQIVVQDITVVNNKRKYF